jgi:hypothetical protein
LAGSQAGSGEGEDGAVSGAFDASTARQIGNAAGYLQRGMSVVYDGALSEQKALEQALREAARVTICGVAPRSLVIALQNLAEEISRGDGPPAWDEIRYITPAQSDVFSDREMAQLGLDVQRWQSALTGIHNCDNRLRAMDPAGTARPTEIAILGTTELYLGVMLILENRDSTRRRAWVSVGPVQASESLGLLVFDEEHEMFGRLKQVVDRMAAGAIPIVTLQLECGLVSGVGDSGQGYPEPAVIGLRPFGATPTDTASCLPVALTALRSAAAGDPILLLKRRTRLTDTDDFGKLSLLSSRLLLSDLAAALNVPVPTDLEPARALDDMWKRSHRAGRMTLPYDAFVRAAQREIFATCGLDIPKDRFSFHGWQVVPREDSPLHLLFFVFEVVLFRGSDGGDELTSAEAWNSENLERVSESQLYAGTYAGQLNRFLTQREDWLREHVFSTAIDPLSKA